MDGRWEPFPLDSKRDARIIWHPVLSINEVRKGVVDGYSTDISDFVTRASHTQFDCSIQVNWNYEFYGVNQPKPNQVLEIQLLQNGEYLPIWIGIIDSISRFTHLRGERSMEILAKSRDSLNIWKTTKRVTELYPMLTDITYIARKIARIAGMEDDEIAIPGSSFTTSHTNTQLADMPAWDMITDLFLPLGWTPFIDGLGRLRAATRELQSPTTIELDSERVVKIHVNRQRPPSTRYCLRWLDPTLKKKYGQTRVIKKSVAVHTGWWRPFINYEVDFSDDRTLRAEKTSMETKTNPNNLFVPVCQFEWEQTTETGGVIHLINYAFAPTLMSLVGAYIISKEVRDMVTVPPGGGTVPVEPIGRREQTYWNAAVLFFLMAIGTGIFDIWGTPYELVHARNTSEAFDDSTPNWVDDPVEVESDFIMNEQHAKAVCTRELIYAIRSANKWSATLIDDPRIEFGDILEFPDGNRMYIEDFTRQLTRGDEALLEVKGFLF